MSEDHEFKSLVINALYVLLFEMNMSESEWLDMREELKRQMERLYISKMEG